MPESKKLSIPWLKKSVKVAVLGDLILDEYLEGQVTRISPEAPVPVHLVSQRVQRPGGAANAALNVQRAGGSAILFGVCGDDEPAQDLKRILTEYRMDTQHLVCDEERPTTKKMRISASKQQIVRVDWEKTHPVQQSCLKQLLDSLAKSAFDVLLISDYGKGALTDEFVKAAISAVNKRNIRVVIDPKGKDYDKYQGAYLITPNRKEACDALDLDSTEKHPKEDLARKLQERFKLANVLVTLGPEGMYLCPERNSKVAPQYLPAIAQEVFDVSGAGDTVAAVLALSIAADAPLDQGIVFATLAAAKVVGKWGTQPIEQHELEDALNAYNAGTSLSRTSHSSRNKIKNVEDLKQILGSAGTRSRRIVFTNGCFDLLHAGHISYLEKARELGDALVVAINDDASVKRLKGPTRPIVGIDERMQLMAALACVDYVVSFSEDTPERVIKDLIPDILVKGADYTKDKIVGGDIVERAGGSVQTIELVPGISTSEITRRIKTDKSV